jgi:Zn-dependent peptidase ImmA (M78 family)
VSHARAASIDLSDINGLTARVRRKNGEPIPVIVIKEGEWSERKRFALPYELGHMVMGVPHGVDAEKAANRFAGAFLMPAEALWGEIGKHRTTISLGELLRIKQLHCAIMLEYELGLPREVKRPPARGHTIGQAQRTQKADRSRNPETPSVRGQSAPTYLKQGSSYIRS